MIKTDGLGNPVVSERMPIIRLFNVKYSPNLGDGLLSECLERALVEQGAAQGTHSVDLAARTDYSAGDASRARLLDILSKLPSSIRTAAISVPLNLQRILKWEPHYRASLADADAIVIGGGNLFTDVDLNFPTKIASVLREATKRGLPVAIYGVGVSKSWSERGLNLMRRRLKAAKICYVSVRDEASKANFDSLFSDAAGMQAIVVRDPGLMVARYVTAGEAESYPAPVGLCITSAIAVRYHSIVDIPDKKLLGWYAELSEDILQREGKITLFTNGSPEDVEFAASVQNALQAKYPELSVVRPTTPVELVKVLSSCRAVVGFRMHAIIAALSYGRPVVAFRWDPKLDALMASVELSDSIVDAVETPVSTVVELTHEQVGRGVPASALIQEAFDSVGVLMASVVKSLR